MSQHVGIAMSGGVDSTAAALLLRENYRLSAFLMNIGQPGFRGQRQRVERLADAIGIELQVIDLEAQFNQLVLTYLSDSYHAGLTPNPCVVCNQKIKFGLFQDLILAAGPELVATGHYARLETTPEGPRLLRGSDRLKDQSYFLARLEPAQLNRILLPLGEWSKPEVYDYVESRGVRGFEDNESQDVCFLEERGLASFLASLPGRETASGPMVSVAGTRLGTHQGLFRYTVGQRRGLGLPDRTPWYVVALDRTTNTLVVGKEEDLYSSALDGHQAHWHTGRPPEPGTVVLARIRSTHPGAEAIVATAGPDHFRLHFTKPQRAVAPGQFCVLYDGERVIGCGVIEHPGALPE